MWLTKNSVINLMNTMKKLDFTPYLGTLNCPIMVICGKKDVPNKQAAKNLAHLIPHVELHIIERSGHEVNKDAPEALAQNLSAFWNKLHS